MELRTLGQTDIKVSVICLGTMTFGEQNTESDAHAQLDYALAQGVNFVDTAELYAVPARPETQGLTERYIGSWLKKTGKREQIILASKVAGPGRKEWIGHIRGGPKLNAHHINQAIENSLKRLNTDYLDLYQVHWPSRSTNYFGQLGYRYSKDNHHETPEETLRALTDLVRAGKVRTLGVSNETPWGVMTYLALARELGLERIVSIQNPYSLLNRSYEIGLAEIAHRAQVGLLAYSPLGFGVLSGKYLDSKRPEGSRLQKWAHYFPRYITQKAQQVTKLYVELAHQYGLDPAQMALAYVNSRPFLTANIIGATTLEQLKMNIASIDLVLSDEVLEGIERIHNEFPNPCP
ncbi:MAG: NADP(H)-dependent aldo-keto reductase [Thiofilum sp.]|uniref:NADP(H)-dependent aldo-keto reductase n=1 Tax=Thiofilum sp. TaxID=2212733 RepID=UPI0025FECF39|nr:NADP(H)-dependent aldo-keto reductase [Thiofilum sp.]MBK8454706.1 NADP(H)-dependent aldo-keto reductase [Thiofilum sp.]